MKGFTLIEVLIVLLIVAIAGFLAFPSLTNRIDREVNFFNELNQTAEQLSLLSGNQTICVNFADNTISISGTLLKSPYKVEYLLSPSILISSKFSEKKCLNFSQQPTVVSIIFSKEKDTFIGYTILTSTGSIIKQELDEAEMETFKDKIYKGRVLEWFKHH